MCHGRSTENGLNPWSAAAEHLRNVVRALYNRGQRSSLRAERAARLGLLSLMAGAARGVVHGRRGCNRQPPEFHRAHLLPLARDLQSRRVAPWPHAGRLAGRLGQDFRTTRQSIAPTFAPARVAAMLAVNWVLNRFPGTRRHADGTGDDCRSPQCCGCSAIDVLNRDAVAIVGPEPRHPCGLSVAGRLASVAAAGWSSSAAGARSRFSRASRCTVGWRADHRRPGISRRDLSARAWPAR